MKNNISTAEEAVQDILNRYDFEWDDDFSTRDKNGRWMRKCMVLINKKDPTKRRFVQWQLSDGEDSWRVFIRSPSPPREKEGVKRKTSVYVEATLRIMQERFFHNRCCAPTGCVTHGRCVRCGGDLVCEMDHLEGKGYAFRFICFGRSSGYCQFITNWRC